MAGLLRLVCANGMVVSDGTLTSIHIRHVGSRQRQLEQVLAGAYTVLEQAPRILEIPAKWSAIYLTYGEQWAFANTALGMRFGWEEDGETPKTTFQPSDILFSRRDQDDGNDLWRTFNRVQENAIQGGMFRRSGQRRAVSSRAVTAIDTDVNINRSLWRLASELADRKVVAS